jgi:hypothetical protein
VREVERVIRLPAQSPAPAVLEVVIAMPARPSRWRRILARALLRLAARLVRMRLRVVADDD